MGNESNIERILQQGIEHHRNNQFLEAEDCYKQVLAIDSNNADAIHLLGLLADSIGDKNLAVDLIRIAISLQPDNAIFHFNLGNVLKTQGQTELAISSYLAALEHDPAHATASFNLANLYRDLEKLDEAVPLYQQTTALSPDLAIAWVNLAESLHKLGQLDEAIESYLKFLELKPDDLYGKTKLADAYFEQGRKAEDLGKPDGAMASFEAALKVLPTHISSRKKLDFLQSEKKQKLVRVDNTAQILACLQQGLEMHKNDQFREAAIFYNQALSLDARNARAHHMLAMAEEAIADQILAARLVAEIVQISAGHSDAIARTNAEHEEDEHPLTQAMLEIWESRSDLQKIYDVEKPERRFEFYKWLLAHGSSEYNLGTDFYPESMLSQLLRVPGLIGKLALAMLREKSRSMSAYCSKIT